MSDRISDFFGSKNIAPLPTGMKSSGSMLTDIKAVIFDIYGTLLVSGSGDVGTALNAGTTEAFQAAFFKAAGFRLAENTASAVKRLFFGLIDQIHSEKKAAGYPYPEVDIIRIWSEILASKEFSRNEDFPSGLAPELIAAAYESTVNPVSPMPGADSLMAFFNSHNFRMGIISNAQFYTPIIFRKLFNADFPDLGFSKDLCLFSYIEGRSKPDTLLFRKLTENLAAEGISPPEAIFVGNDMLKDIIPASVSGFKTVLFAGDKRSLRLREDYDACRNIKPDVIVNNLIDLTDFIQEGQHEKTFRST